jgi:hypothetical protein
MNKELLQIKLSIRRWLMFFMMSLIISGATAFDVQSGMVWLRDHIDIAWANDWINNVYHAVEETDQKFPFLFYGYDWMAFAHIVIAIAFIGPYRDPVKNEWVIEFGMIACTLVIPAALLFGAIRQIPFWWRMIDAAFGIIGLIPLSIVWVKIQQLKLANSVHWHAVIKKAAKDISSSCQLANAPRQSF